MVSPLACICNLPIWQACSQATTPQTPSSPMDLAIPKATPIHMNPASPPVGCSAWAVPPSSWEFKEPMWDNTWQLVLGLLVLFFSNKNTFQIMHIVDLNFNWILSSVHHSHQFIGVLLTWVHVFLKSLYVVLKFDGIFYCRVLRFSGPDDSGLPIQITTVVF